MHLVSFVAMQNLLRCSNMGICARFNKHTLEKSGGDRVESSKSLDRMKISSKFGPVNARKRS